jgi:ubiquinone/menaquinone biosynthesis C-methylase UbiE
MSQFIKQFYDRIAFPGSYSMEQLLKYGTPIENPYLRIIEEQITNNQTVLDAGCGTGLTTNLFALRNPTCQFTGIDFSNSIDLAESFSVDNTIKNVKFIKQDLEKITLDESFDLVICQGVLHHIPNYQQVLTKLKNMVNPGGKLILGLYHPAGKIAKQFFNIDYKSTVLFQDQECNPFETSFTVKQVKKMTLGWEITQCTPKFVNSVVVSALFNYKNGGLVTYILERNNNELD